MPNRISLSGHTDTTPYSPAGGYTNWDLSADRANARAGRSRAAAWRPTRSSRVVGLSSSVLFDKENPRNPINRRISIIVMTKEAEESALKTDAMPESAGAAPAQHAAGHRYLAATTHRCRSDRGKPRRRGCAASRR